MVGYSLKKIAKENGLKLDKGVAYGSYRGFAVTLSEGMGYKRVAITTIFQQAEMMGELKKRINEKNLRKEFRITELLFAGDGMIVTFYDNLGTMKKIRRFFDWIFPLLEQYEASKANICTRCGKEITDGCWKLLDGAAYHMHMDCGDSFSKAHRISEEVANAEKNGSYFQGFCGALLGAIVGAVIWAIVLNLGYVAAIVGFLIGWLAEKGYNLLHGKQGKGKVIILVVTILLGVLLGTVSADVLGLAQMIQSGELAGFAYQDIPWMLTILMMDGEYLAGIGYNLLLGIVFAALGVYALIHKTGKAVQERRVIDLK